MSERASDTRPANPGHHRQQATDPIADAIVRREEEFRRFLVSVVTPAFDELRAEFRAAGREARSQVTTRPGRPAEATITVSNLGEPEFFCTVHAAMTPAQATVLKRRPVPPAPATDDPPEVQSTTLNPTEAQSNATAITRADVVLSVRTDYWVLRR